MRAKEFDSEASVGTLCRAFDSTFGASSASTYRVTQTKATDSGATLIARPQRHDSTQGPAQIRLRAIGAGSTRVTVTAKPLPSALLIVTWFTIVGAVSAVARHAAAVDPEVPANAASVAALALGGPVALTLLLRWLLVTPPKYALSIVAEVLNASVAVPSQPFFGTARPLSYRPPARFPVAAYPFAGQYSAPVHATVHAYSTEGGRTFVTPAPMSEVVGLLREYRRRSGFLDGNRASLQTTFKHDSITSGLAGDLRYSVGSGKHSTTYYAEVVCSATPQGTSVFVKPVPMAPWRFLLMGIACAAMTYGAFVYGRQSWHGPLVGTFLVAGWLNESARGRTQASKERVLAKVEDVLREQVADHFAQAA
jgi:hypothetical protein